MDCLRRKHPKKRDHKKHHVSPSHSQPSTLNTTVNSTLPKAGNSGLWIDKPGLYAMALPHKYYYGRPQEYNTHSLDRAYQMPRAVSETRIPHAGPYIPNRHPFGSQSNVFLIPVSGQRFYHSQQMTPVYELPPTRGMEIYDYPYTGADGMYRSKMLETRHTPDYYNINSEFILRPRVERANSDAKDKKPKSPQGRKEKSKVTNEPAEEKAKKAAIKENLNWHSLIENEKQQLGYYGAQTVSNDKIDRFHNAFSIGSIPTESIGVPSNVYNYKTASLQQLPPGKDSVVIENTQLNAQRYAHLNTQLTTQRNTQLNTFTSNPEDITSSATDSMKILAKNKTDDQKIKPNFPPAVFDSNDNRLDENDRELGIQHYTYEGSIYSIPNKNKNDDYDNPIITRMKEMVIERSRNSNIMTNMNDHRDAAPSKSSMQTPVLESESYKGIAKVKQVTKTKVIESLTPSSLPDTTYTNQQATAFNDVVDSFELPDILVPDEKNDKGRQNKNQHNISDRPLTSVAYESKNELKESTAPMPGRIANGLYLKDKADTDGNSDDLNRAGKQLATSAFQFLDNYLSDDEGTESLVEAYH